MGININTHLTLRKFAIEPWPISISHPISATITSILIGCIKVQIFWESHKILRNLHFKFDADYIQSNLRGWFPKILWPSHKTSTLQTSLLDIDKQNSYSQLIKNSLYPQKTEKGSCMHQESNEADLSRWRTLDQNTLADALHVKTMKWARNKSCCIFIFSHWINYVINRIHWVFTEKFSQAISSGQQV